MAEKRFAKDNIRNLTPGDLVDAVYGAIQSLIERGRPDNVVFHYFLPAIPFGPELAAFMDLGAQPKEIGNSDQDGTTLFTGNDLVRSAVNFARIADLIPTVGEVLKKTSGADDATVVDLNSLIASGRTISLWCLQGGP
jgi:hypothetical protein